MSNWWGNILFNHELASKRYNTSWRCAMKQGRGSKTLLVKILVYVAILLVIALFGYFVWRNTTSPTIYELELSEISNGVYAYRGDVVSSIPAQNYATATLCDTSGNIYTIKGTVRIINTNHETPHAVLESYNIVNSDTVTLYVPSGTVQYIGTTSVGSR